MNCFTAPVEDTTATPETSTGTSKVKVIVDDEEFNFEMSKEQSILEASLKQKIDAPYSCQGGICSSCIARITEGYAVMRQNKFSQIMK